MDIKAAYNDWSMTYDLDRNLTRDLDQLVTHETLSGMSFKSILELGCGTGKNTSMLARIGEQVRAVDFSAGMIARARERDSPGNVRFTIADITQPWPFADQSFDLTTCNLVLEHVRELPFVFAEASRVLVARGRFFISELHPFRQYQGTQANFLRNQKKTEIQAFVHHISDFVESATANGLALGQIKEWWHQEDQNKPPRLVSFMFKK
jgi:malonyl-CoA O-methyltransferase